MPTGPTEFQAVAALTLVVAAAVIPTAGYRGVLAKVQFIPLEAAPEIDTIGYNPSGVALPP